MRTHKMEYPKRLFGYRMAAYIGILKKAKAVNNENLYF